MAEALKPSIEITGKQNVNPSINRITEATAEDFQEIGNILIDHANKLNEIARTDEEAEYYGVHGSLAGVQAAFPDAPNNSWAVIDPGNGNPKNIATVVNGVWEVNQLIAPILLFNTKFDRDLQDPGAEGVIYVIKDEKIFSLWYDGKYNDFGKDGNNGLSAYQVAVAFAAFQGTEAEWVESLKGKSAYQVAVANGFQGTEAEWVVSLGGIPGKSAYEVAVDNGFQGTEAEWIASIEGVEGKSAYQVAVANGFAGTEAEWLISIEGEPGDPGPEGDSAYQVWLNAGNVGTEQDYIDSLKGSTGKDGTGINFKTDLEASNTKATPANADLFGYLNSAASNVLVKFTWTNIKAALKTYFDTLYIGKLPPLIVDASRNLAATDNGRKLYVTVSSTLTYPTGGLGANFEFNIVTAATITATIAGTTLFAPNGTILTENKMGHCFVEPVNNKLSLNGGFTQ